MFQVNFILCRRFFYLLFSCNSVIIWLKKGVANITIYYDNKFLLYKTLDCYLCLRVSHSDHTSWFFKRMECKYWRLLAGNCIPKIVKLGGLHSCSDFVVVFINPSYVCVSCLDHPRGILKQIGLDNSCPRPYF